MSGPDDGRDGLRERLLRELDRGDEANLGGLFEELGVFAAPPAELDEKIEAAAREAAAEAVQRSELAEPPPEIDAKILQAARDAVRHAARRDDLVEQGRRWIRPVVAAVALAVAVALGFGLGRLFAPTTVARDGKSRSLLPDDVQGRLVDAKFPLACEAERLHPGDGLRFLGGSGPSSKEWGSPGRVVDPTTLVRETSANDNAAFAPDDQDRFAAELVASCEELRRRSPDLARGIHATLERSQGQCSERSLCRARIALATARVALDLGERDDAARNAATAKAFGDPETRALAQRFMDDASLPDSK